MHISRYINPNLTLWMILVPNCVYNTAYKKPLHRCWSHVYQIARKIKITTLSKGWQWGKLQIRTVPKNGSVANVWAEWKALCDNPSRGHTHQSPKCSIPMTHTPWLWLVEPEGLSIPLDSLSLAEQHGFKSSGLYHVKNHVGRPAVHLFRLTPI